MSAKTTGLLGALIVAGVIMMAIVSGIRASSDSPDRDFKLPESAGSVRNLGNGWCTFSLKTEGATRHFIYHQRYDTGTSPETLVELHP